MKVDRIESTLHQASRLRFKEKKTERGSQRMGEPGKKEKETSGDN
jgi:hypothetical protein